MFEIITVGNYQNNWYIPEPTPKPRRNTKLRKLRNPRHVKFRISDRKTSGIIRDHQINKLANELRISRGEGIKSKVKAALEHAKIFGKNGLAKHNPRILDQTWQVGASD